MSTTEHIVARASDAAADEPLARFRAWFYAAAFYNATWGCAAIFAPGPLTELAGLPERSGVLVQGLGLLVLVYAPGFLWAARRPDRHAHIVAIALLGKSLAVVGFAWSAAVGTLAPSFGLTVVTNDAVWLAPFALYLRAVARAGGGWRDLVGGVW